MEASAPNYAVEAEAQFVVGDENPFALLARGGEVSVNMFADNGETEVYLAHFYIGDERVGTDDYYLVSHSVSATDWHLYRLEVNGNLLRLLIDGTVIAEVTDNRLLSATGTSVGVACGQGAQVNVRSFRVIAL
jgi:hypothetical protein